MSTEKQAYCSSSSAWRHCSLKQITKLELNNLFVSSDYADVIATTQAAARYCLVLYKCELTNSNYAYLTTGCYQPHVVNSDSIQQVTIEITPQ